MDQKGQILIKGPKSQRLLKRPSDGSTKKVSNTVMEMKIQQQRQAFETTVTVSIDLESDLEPEAIIPDSECKRFLEAESVSKSRKGHPLIAKSDQESFKSYDILASFFIDTSEFKDDGNDPAIEVVLINIILGSHRTASGKL